MDPERILARARLLSEQMEEHKRKLLEEHPEMPAYAPEVRFQATLSWLLYELAALQLEIEELKRKAPDNGPGHGGSMAV